MMEQFFEMLFGTKPPNDFILTWEKHNKLSSWFCDITEASTYAREHSNHDIYVGCGTSHQNFGPRSRCRADLIAGIPGFWLDLDMKDPAHKQINLPATEEQVQSVLSCFPLKPSMDIHSGHGRQFWWALSEFWTFESVEERMRGASLMQRFNVMFRDHAKSLGFALDMTFDLARILRIPGTTNYKGVPAMPVMILESNNNRYSIDEIDELVPEIAAPPLAAPVQAAKISRQNLVLNPHAEPPYRKLEILKDIEPLFKSSWEMTRKFAGGKGSGSEYDLSLATFAFQAGWSWQEVADMLIAFRVKHNLKPKTEIEGDATSPLREQYYVGTLIKAQAGIVNQQVYDNLENHKNGIGDLEVLEPEQQREAIRAHLTELLGFPCDRIVMQMTTPPVIRIETPRGNINIGHPRNLITQRLLKDCLTELKITLVHQSTVRWAVISEALLASAEEIYMGEESSMTGIVTAWLQQYLASRNISYDPKEAIKTMDPFVSGNMFYIFGPAFCKWMRIMQREAITAKDFSLHFKDFGFTPTPTVHNVKKDYNDPNSEMTTRNSWRLPITHPVLAEFIDFALVQNINQEEATGEK